MADPNITPPPVAPSRDETGFFSQRMDAFLSWLVGFSGEITAAIAWIGERSAATEAAAGGAAADAWISGGNYSAGQSFYSPVDFQSYRAKTDHSGVLLDPSQDATNWAVYTLGRSPNLNSVEVSGVAKLAGLQETVVTLAGVAPDIDLAAGTVFTLLSEGNTAFTFSNPAAAGAASAFTLRLTAGGDYTLTWPASVVWSGGTAPDAPASGETDVLTFLTTDAGATWFGFVAGDAMA
jgi:hypothetical protein